MKRWEMISILANVLVLTGNGRDLEDAERILDYLEKFGMKPPRYTKVSESNEIEAVEGWEDE